jgi:hypothetical protein
MNLVSAVRLIGLIEEVRLKAEAHNMRVSKLCADGDEVEFCFRRTVGNKEEWPLFFGCYPWFWKTDPRPFLCCGAKVDLKDRFDNAVREVLKEQTITDGIGSALGFQMKILKVEQRPSIPSWLQFGASCSESSPCLHPPAACSAQFLFEQADLAFHYAG